MHCTKVEISKKINNSLREYLYTVLWSLSGQNIAGCPSSVLTLVMLLALTLTNPCTTREHQLLEHRYANPSTDRKQTFIPDKRNLKHKHNHKHTHLHGAYRTRVYQKYRYRVKETNKTITLHTTGKLYLNPPDWIQAVLPHSPVPKSHWFSSSTVHVDHPCPACLQCNWPTRPWSR